MKKITKKMLLSVLSVLTAVTATVATAFSASIKGSASGNSVSETSTSSFEMVDGASIRMATPMGLRFIAQMDESEYTSLMKEENGVEKQMGMFIMPYSYLNDESKYSDGAAGVEKKNYQNITTKINHVFYDSADTSVENKIYRYEEGVYRANGVISNLMLANYDRDFVGIAYIATTTGGTTKYTFADFDAAENVRSSTYVAIEAYEDYTEDKSRAVFNEYVLGAHMETKGMTSTSTGSGASMKTTFTYNGATYTTATAAAKAAGVSLSVSLDRTVGYIKNKGASLQLTATIKDGSTPVTFNGAHAIWSSSDESILTVDKNGKVTAVADGGKATITANFMGTKATCEVFVSTIDFEDGSLTNYISAGGRSTVAIAEHDGDKALKVTAEMSNEGNARVLMKYSLIDAFFADSSIAYMAFDLKVPETATTGAKIYYNAASGSGWTQYEPGNDAAYDSAPKTAYKTYYFPRSIYEAWIANGKADMRFLNVGSGVTQGASYYVDNIRAVTADEYKKAAYSFEYGDIRTNNGNQPLFYIPTEAGVWQLGINGIDSTTVKFTNEIVSDGMRALQFTKVSGESKITFNHNTDTSMEKEMRAAGYITYDLYVPEGSNARLLNSSNTVYKSLEQGWNTIYARVDATDNFVSRIYDSTKSTYVIDNIQFITEDEYYAGVYGMEMGGGTVRTQGDAAKGTAYWYAEGYDSEKVFYSIAFTNSVTEIGYDDNVVHDGEYSLKVVKDGDMNLQFRADTKTYETLRNGLSFWIYSTIGVNGTTTTNLLNGNSQKLNGGAGINIPKNTWTQIFLTKSDIVQGSGEAGCAFFRILGSTNGTYYIDGMKPIETLTINFNAGSGTVSKVSQEIAYGMSYTLPVPSGYGDFLGWYDENNNLVPMTGVWDKKEGATLTAKYDKIISFEDGVIPSFMTTNTSLSIANDELDVTIHGNNALKISGSNGAPNLTVPIEFLAYYFEDESVDYIAFSAKTGFCFTNNFRRVTERPKSGGGYECVAVCYENDNGFNGITSDAWKTYYFSRTDYEMWQKYGYTTSQFIATGGFDKTDAIYIDYIHPITQAEYLRGNYSLEGGSIRLNDNNLLMYMPYVADPWQWCLTQSEAPSDYGWDSETKTHGNRSLYFAPVPGVTSTIRFNSANVQFAKDMMATGYYAFDLYIPEGANTQFTAPIGGDYATSLINEGGWRTVYSNTTTFCAITTDTADSYYFIDNFRSVTREEYEQATNSFEMGTTGGIRQTELESDNVFYYYTNNGTDYNKVLASFNFAGGNGATLSNPRFSNFRAHSGTTSLAFDKTNGSMAFGMHVNSKSYKTLRNGFSFWIYSTVGINGVSADNIVDGNGKKLGENGLMVPAETWTKVTIEKGNFNGTTFLKIAGSTAGTIYIDDIEALPYEESNYYNSEAESEVNGVLTNLTLEQSTHTAGTGVLPQNSSDWEDMSYYRFKGEYGLDDYLVFDFTGNTMPILSFFNTEVTETVYNQAQDAEMKGWIVTNTMLLETGLPYGGYTGAHANRITLIGPYKISYKYDDNGSNQALTQVRTSIYKDASGNNEPNPASMAQLNVNDQYRVIVGWVENGTNMNLRMIVWNLTEGVKVAEYNQGGVPKADWKGDIALYGHFGTVTKVDKVYPIVNGWDNALAQYTPSMLSYKATWDGNGVTLAASTYEGNVSYPTSADMPYVAFNGKYGSGDYVVFDMTGSNMPIVSFFNNTITNTIYNNNGTGSTATVKDASVTGWVWANGLYLNDGSMYGGATGAHASRLALIGKQKVIGYDQNTNGFRSNLGDASNVHPLSIRKLAEVTDTYRVIIGIRQNNANSVYVDMYALNMITGKQVYKESWYVGTGISAEGSIILYGQFGKTTVLDTVFGVEENTTLDALIAKYAKDFDYSDEAAVELDRYGYSSVTDGTYKVDNTVYHSSDGSACSGTGCTSAAHIDPRKDQATYNTYAAAGFNILFPQTAFGVDSEASWAQTKEYMDMAANAGLKVILHDWHISVLSTPLKVGKNANNVETIVAADSTYKPWVLASDVNADGTGKTQVVQDYLDALALYGLTADTTRFKDQNALDSYLMNEMRLYKDHPAFYGMMLGDEPTYANAYCYGMIYNSLKRIMPEIYVQYNLLPLENNLSTVKYRYPGLKSVSSLSNSAAETAYKNYVTRFLDAMNTDYIQYDDYPFKSKREIVDYKYGVVPVYGDVPYIDTPALRCIQLIAEIAKERDLTVKVVTQSSVMESNGTLHIRKLTEADARWLNNYLLGFGVKQINYFTYWTKADNKTSGEYFEDGGSFVNHDGSTTAIYDIMQAIMADNDKFAPTISQFGYSDSHVYGSNNDSNLNNDHISFSSSLTDTNYSFKYLTNVTTSKEYTLVTELFDAEKYNYMYMIMNTIDPYYGGTQNVTVTLDSSVTAFYVYDQSGNRTLVSGNSYTVSLTAGQAVYIMPCQFA